MNNLTIGKKIALGFSALILIAALLGGMAVFNMKSVQSQSQTLATEFVPESQIAGDLAAAFAEVSLSMRSYALTSDKAYLTDGKKQLAEVHKQQAAAQQLANEHPELAKLQANIKQLAPTLQHYEELLGQTEAKNEDILTGREKLNQTASDFIANMDKLIAGQKIKQADEIKTNADAKALQARADKLALANELRGSGNAVRIAVFKSQALRDPKLIEEGLKGFVTMDKRFDELLAMLTAQEDIAELNRVKNDAHTYRDAMKATMDDNLALVEIGKKRLESYNQVNALVMDTQDTGMARTVEVANASTKKLTSASWTMIVGLIGALVVGVIVAILIIRNANGVLTSVAHALDDGAHQVVSAAGQVSSASQTLAEGASEQASSLEETSSSLEEMASMIQRNSEHARQANDLGKEAREAADKGVGDMQTMAAAMADIKVSSDDIAKIIKTIDEIAFQTNILALNAAVEAARAGEAGMGFAVVADEVRNLAQRCAQAAKETAGKIEGAIVKTGQGVEISSKVAEALNEIAAKVRRVDELVTEVASASREQTQGITQINSAVGQMDKVTQGNAATAEESAAAAEELNAQAETMKQSVTELLHLVGGQSGAAAARPATHVNRTQPVRATFSATKQAPHKNGNGHGQPASKQPQLAAGRKGDIPMGENFENF